MVRAVTRYVVARLDVRSERAATAIEYAILASGIAVVIILAVYFLGATTNQNFECTGTSYATSTSAC